MSPSRSSALALEPAAARSTAARVTIRMTRTDFSNVDGCGGRGQHRYPGAVDPLNVFSRSAREWFEQAFAAPTPAQALGWPAIAAGGHVLIPAPTGSRETLRA